MSANKFEIFKEITMGGLGKDQLIRRLSEAGIQYLRNLKTCFGLESIEWIAFLIGQGAMSLSLLLKMMFKVVRRNNISLVE